MVGSAVALYCRGVLLSSIDPSALSRAQVTPLSRATIRAGDSGVTAGDTIPQREATVLWGICTALSLLTLLPWPIVVYASIFMFDNPSDGQYPWLLAAFGCVLSYPVAVVGGAIAGFFARKRNVKRAFAFILLPPIGWVLTFALIMYVALEWAGSS